MDDPKVDAIDTSGFAIKTQFNIDKSDQEKKINDADQKIPDISGFIKNTDLFVKKKDVPWAVCTVYFRKTSVQPAMVENRMKKKHTTPYKYNTLYKKYFSFYTHRLQTLKSLKF